MKSAVVDTNVGVVANARDIHASPDCVLSCIDFLQAITRGEVRVVLDAGWEILTEYQGQLSSTGQPGPGDAFLKWLLQNQANPERCEQVQLHPTERWDYEEFPADPTLEAFDPADRKFAAVARVSPSEPSVVNAVDSDWWEHEQALARHGIRVDLLCPDEVERWERKGSKSR